MWKNGWNVQLCTYSLNHIDVHVEKLINGVPWRFTSIYGFPNDIDKHKT